MEVENLPGGPEGHGTEKAGHIEQAEKMLHVDYANEGITAAAAAIYMTATFINLLSVKMKI